MDWKQFISEIISSITWPAVVLFILLNFKGELSKIIRRLAHLKFKDLELDFEKVKQHAEELHLTEPKEKPELKGPALSSLEEQILDAVERAPSAAILLAWSGLESSIAAAVSRLGISPDSPSYRSPMHNIDMLAQNKRLSNTHKKLLHEMRILRNKIAHERETMVSISQDQALDYASTAIELIKHFEGYNRIG